MGDLGSFADTIRQSVAPDAMRRRRAPSRRRLLLAHAPPTRNRARGPSASLASLVIDK